MFELRQDCRQDGTVKTRVIAQLKLFPATIPELESAGCGSRSQIRRVLKSMSNVWRMSEKRAYRYGFTQGEGYRMLP